MLYKNNIERWCSFCILDYRMTKQYKFGTVLLLLVFVLYLSIWVALNTLFPSDSEYFDYFSDTYGLVAALGGIFGFFAARRWGGLKSSMGQALTFFSAGLFFQFLGQISYAVYFYVFNIENAYPSIGDFFYFGSIPLYIFAIVRLFEVLQIKSSIHGTGKRLIAFILPVAIITATYYTFLNGYEYSPDAVLTTLLDFGYPLGGAIILGLTIIAFLFSTSTLGGKLKFNIILLFLALVAQYMADTLYLVHTMRDTWRAGGIDDMFYLIAYAAMGFTLISFEYASEQLISKPETN